MRTIFLSDLLLWLNKLQPRNLIFVSPQFVLADLGDEIPDNYISVFRATRQSHAGSIEHESRYGGAVAVEAYDNGSVLVPQPNAAIFISDGEDIFVDLALGNGGYLRITSRIPPSVEYVARLYIPANDLLVSSDNGLAGARAGAIFRRPKDVRGGGSYKAERFRKFIFSVIDEQC